jgi:hypothetical protein
MRAYLIDATNRTVTAVDWSGEFQQPRNGAYALTGCSILEAVYTPSGETIYVDEEGLFKLPRDDWFTVAGCPQPLAGNGLWTGPADDQGEETEPTSTLEQARAAVRFCDMFQVVRMARVRR